MNESVILEDFSALDDWLPEAPQWQPYRPEAMRERQASERADSAAG
ncbi:hypothetical protein SBC1_65340 (plasmid) [Caballeronia sp. SBC1]|nr:MULTISPECIES: hypothetical protein [unclassified Caballeronia]QIE28430.1 hypothetical protein SBC2_65060 [Caballeronia sp. SBC2]QIN66487.1 hypothetical protein SBC1_65340 [Caballeronia sp. SBC1]